MTTTLATGKTTVDYSGASVQYTAPNSGAVAVKLWAPGGGGGLCATGSTGQALINATGANGGFTTFTVSVNAGDVLEVWVGGGGSGAKATSNSGGSAGAAGWPDGGAGGANASFLYCNGGGGGGSTRIYLNGTLIGVAGAAGGAGAGASLSSGTPGYGGGTQGQPQTGVCTGGTQTAGGTNANSVQNGASLKGGQGSNTGSTAKTGTSSTNPAGGGGGGGYFGGAGGGNTPAGQNNSANPGAGGSGWFSPIPSVTGGSTTAGTSAGTGGHTDVDYQSGVGVGAGPGKFGGSYPVSGGVGGSGQVVLNYVAAANVNVSGSIPTVTLSTHPLGGVITGAGPNGPIAAIGTVTLSKPTASAGLPGTSHVALPGPITLTAPLGGLEIAAFIVGPINDGGAPVTLTPPTLSVQGAAHASQYNTQKEIDLSPPAASITGHASGALPTLFVVRPLGDAQGGIGISGAIGSLHLSAPAAAPSVPALALGALKTITLGAPTVVVRAAGLLPTLSLAAPAGSAEESGIVGRGPIGVIALSVPAASATGVAAAHGALSTVTLSKPVAAGHGAVAISHALPSLTITPPAAAALVRVTPASPLPAVSLAAPGSQVTAGVHVSPAGVLKVTAQVPVGHWGVSGSATGQLPTTPIMLTPPAAGVKAVVAGGLPTISVGVVRADRPTVSIAGHPLPSIGVTPVTPLLNFAVNLHVAFPLPIQVKALTAAVIAKAAVATIVVAPPTAYSVISGSAEGELPTVTLSEPDGIPEAPADLRVSIPEIIVGDIPLAGTLVGTPKGALETVSLSPIIGGVPGNVAAPLPLIQIVPVFPFGQQGAFIVVPLDLEVALTTPTGRGQGAADIDWAPLDPTKLTLALSAPRGSMAAVATGALPGPITLVGPHGVGVAGAGAEVSFPTVSLTSPEALGAGAVAVADAWPDRLPIYLIPPLPPHSPGDATGALPQVDLAGPVAQTSIEVSAASAFPTITLTPPKLSFLTPVEPLDIQLTAPAVSAKGAAHVSFGTLWGWFINLNYLTYGPYGPLGSAHVSTAISRAVASPIVLSPPSGFAAQGALVTLPAVQVTPPTASVMVGIDVLPAPLNVRLGVIQGITQFAITVVTALPGAIHLGAPAGFAAVSPTVYVIAPQGYADDSQPGKLRFWRAEVSGNTPNALVEREIALNEATGVLFRRDPTGNVVQTPFGGLHEGGMVPSSGQNGQILLADGSWSVPSPISGLPVRVSTSKTGPGEYFVLSEGSLGVQSVLLPLGTALYRPFFVAKSVQVTQIGLSVQGPVAGEVTVGISTWNIGNRTPVQLLAQAVIDVSASGDLFVPVSLTLAPGWYAAIVACAGAAAPQVTSTIGPINFASDLSAAGDPTAPFTGSLTPLPQPDGVLSTAQGIVMAALEPA